MHVAGEKHYVALILQNLLENARKYNRPGGRIRISCSADGDWATLTIGNTGRSIPGPAREHIFERFHRGSVGEDIKGHGLGLNLARELVRLHGGEVRLVAKEGQILRLLRITGLLKIFAVYATLEDASKDGARVGDL